MGAPVTGENRVSARLLSLGLPWEKVCGTEISGRAPQVGKLPPLSGSQSLGQPPKHVPPKGHWQPLPWGQAPPAPLAAVSLIPAEVRWPGAPPRLAGPPRVCGRCSAVPGCPWAQSLCDRGDRAQPVSPRGSVPQQCHQLPPWAWSHHGAHGTGPSDSTLKWPHTKCPSLPAWPGLSPTPRGPLAGEGVLGTELSLSSLLPVQRALPWLCWVVCTPLAPAPARFCLGFLWWDCAGEAWAGERAGGTAMPSEPGYVLGHRTSAQTGKQGGKGGCLGAWLQGTAMKEHI